MSNPQIQKVDDSAYVLDIQDDEHYTIIYERKHWKVMLGESADNETARFWDVNCSKELKKRKAASLLNALIYIAASHEEHRDDLMKQAAEIVRPLLG